MVHFHRNDAPRLEAGVPFASGTKGSGTATGGERIGIFVLLPESGVLAAVGDLDLVHRLREHVHLPATPGWSCTVCPQPWPCAEAKQELLIDLGWVRLPVYCSVLLEQAARDLPNAYPHELWDRFIAWTQPLHGIHDPRLRPPSF